MRIAIVLISLSSLALVSTAQAVENLSTAELASHCAHFPGDPGGADGIFCVRYVQGFIDGAVATDERVTNNVAAEIEREESFSERAIRTRLGPRLQRFPSYFAEFCLGEPVPLAEVVGHVVDSLAETAGDRRPEFAREAVYQILREHYPCESDDA
ncbi:MAG: Rap1a/Tai family immunity protein [Lysobacterales bacterium]|jgi:hypothetical protein